MLTTFLKNQYDNLVRSLKAYSNAIDEATAIAIIDLPGKIIYANEKFTSLSNYSASELAGKKLHNLITTENSIKYFDEIWQTINRGKHWKGEIKSKTKNGNYCWLDMVIMPVVNEKNEIFQYLSVSNLIKDKKEDDHQYINLFNKNPVPNCVADKQTLQFLEVNESAKKLYGYSSDEFSVLTFYDLIGIGDSIRFNLQLKKNNSPSEKIIQSHRKKDGTIVKAEVLIAGINYKGKEAWHITINDATENIRVQEELMRTKILQQNEISRVSMELHEKNRAEIGRELHDNVNQLLVASNLYLKNIKIDSPNKELIEKSISINTTAINEIRKLAWSLVPPSLKDLSLKDTIEEASNIFELMNASFEMNIKIQEDAIPDGLKINLYRIIQEQFNNIIKHSNASKVSLSLSHEKKLLRLEISDNGKGFDQKMKTNGIGMTNIIHRVETYNGITRTESSPGNGCSLHVEFIL